MAYSRGAGMLRHGCVVCGLGRDGDIVVWQAGAESGYRGSPIPALAGYRDSRLWLMSRTSIWHLRQPRERQAVAVVVVSVEGETVGWAFGVAADDFCR